MPSALLHLVLDWMYAGLHLEGPGRGSDRQGELDIEPGDWFQTSVIRSALSSSAKGGGGQASDL